MKTPTSYIALAILSIGSSAVALTTLPTLADAADQTFGADNGAHITMWSRAATQVRADALVKAYNATHKNHIDVTYVPTDDYQTKVGAAYVRQLAAGICSRPTSFSCPIGRRQDCSRISPLASPPCPTPRTSRRARSAPRPGTVRDWPAVRRRSLGLDVQQGTLQASWPRPGETAQIAY